MKNFWCFENVNLYKILCPHKIKAYAQNHFQGYSKGDFIYFPEDASHSVYMVSKGKVKIVTYTEEGTELVKAILGRGEIFGEKALLGETMRHDYAIACSQPTQICPMTLSAMQELMRENQRFGLSIYKLIGLRVRRLERRFESLLFKDVRTRLVEFIRELFEEKGHSVGELKIIKHQLTQKDFADLIGTRRETVTRLFNEFKQEGVIAYDRREIRILDPTFLGKEN